MSPKKASIIPEKIHLFSINIFKANLDTSDEFLDNPRKVKAFEFGLANELAHNYEKGRARYRLFFTLDGHDAKRKPLGVKVEYGIEFHFQVDNFRDFAREKESGEVEIDVTLGATLLSMAYSTARGIVYERTRGTFFDGVVLPVIDPYKALLEKKEEVAN